MKTTMIVLAALCVAATANAQTQGYSTLPPSVVGQPAVAIHSHGNAPQVYQYSPTPSYPQPQSPSSTFVYDAGTNRGAFQTFGGGGITIHPIQPSTGFGKLSDD